MRLLLTTALAALPFAAHAQDAPEPKLPDVATEIVIEDLTLSVKKLRLGLALSPEQIDNITEALSSSAAKAGGETSDGASENGSEDDTSSDD